MKDIPAKLTAFLSSRLFLRIVLGFFVFEALWFVFSAMYPMAFDEEFHLGVIEVYAQEWLPFFSSQPPGADQFGAVFRDPSYFYHYLLSFPYRLVAAFTSNETVIVILLRLINVALFTWGLLLFRKVMLLAKASPALANVSLAVFVLIPIVPQLAAHINYDNALMVLVPALCLVSYRLLQSFRERRIDMFALLWFLIIGVVMSVVKYASLPIVVAAVGFLLAYLLVSFRGKYGKIWRIARNDLLRIGRRTRIALVVTAAIAFGLFAQRYLVNMVDYGRPVPDCGNVLSVKQCSAYGPWVRDHEYHRNIPKDFKPSLAQFIGNWFKGMWHRLFFAINGKKAFYMNYRELPLPSTAAIVLAVGGLLAVVIWLRPILRGNLFLGFLLVLSLFYIIMLWLDGFAAYKYAGKAVAINGRYLLPVLLLLAVAIGRALSSALYKVPNIKPYLAVVTILVFLHGGGVLTFILRSDSGWYWNNPVVVNVNNTARKVLAPIIIEGRNY
ncbi:MAG TPA: hypothetical protein VFM05_12810 [Candidatus Saccharimonadales bacterium]|nr:hypothetical protein [Candidatus Saccharimonadales bacterium]